MSQKYLIVVQPSLTASNYVNEPAFASTIDSYMTRALGSVSEPSQKLVVFPEMIGAWLIGAMVPNVDKYTTMDQALIRLIIRHPLSFGFSLLKSIWTNGLKKKVMEHVKRSIFAMGGSFLLNTYFRVFSEAAKKHKCWIVAGSALLPNIEFNTGSRLFNPPKITEPDQIYNMSFTFDPEGGLVHVVKKVFLTAEELFLDRCTVDKLSCFDSPFGRVGVLICADCWFPASYSQLQSLTADVIVVPAMSANAKAWHELWQGYSAAETPADVDKGLINKEGVTLSHMWQKYGLKDRLNAKWGAVSYLVGRMWDMDSAGESIIVRGPDDTTNTKGCEANRVCSIAQPDQDTILVQDISYP